MDTLDQTEWDVVISGTGLPQSLLALSLSRSGKKILHIDRNEYYGGDEAALSLSEAEEWAFKHRGDDSASRFSDASIIKPTTAEEQKDKLGFSRAYSLALAPHIIYARSNLLPTLVSSRTHNQLEFQAVGSWFTISKSDAGDGHGVKLTRVPNGREDVFQDDTFNLRTKRSLMKFLRFVSNFEEQPEWLEKKDKRLSSELHDTFGIPVAAHGPLLALAMTRDSAPETNMSTAVPRIAQHLRSIGMFGAGFSAVLPKWGGLAEVAQVACRSGAVGGGVYVLNKGVTSAAKASDGGLTLGLSDGEHVTSKWLAGSHNDLPRMAEATDLDRASGTVTMKSISIVSSGLPSLFPPTSEGGVTPAGAVVVADCGDPSSAPVHIIVHSSESGECPTGQCILYASTSSTNGFGTLEAAVDCLLRSVDEQPPPKVLWRMQYTQHDSEARTTASNVDSGVVADSGFILLRPLSIDMVLEDDVLEDVKGAWLTITCSDGEQFMRFEAREGLGNEDEDFA